MVMFRHTCPSTAHPYICILIFIDLNYSVPPIVSIQYICTDCSLHHQQNAIGTMGGYFGCRFRTSAACRAIRQLMKLLVGWERHEPRQPCTTRAVLPAGRAQTAGVECMLMPSVDPRKLVVTWLMAGASFISDG